VKFGVVLDLVCLLELISKCWISENLNYRVFERGQSRVFTKDFLGVSAPICGNVRIWLSLLGVQGLISLSITFHIVIISMGISLSFR
jgi:hypothetical protein